MIYTLLNAFIFNVFLPMWLVVEKIKKSIKMIE